MALVVGRRPGESILIDGKTKVTVVKSDNDMLRLKIDAPDDVNIVREELLNNKTQ